MALYYFPFVKVIVRGRLFYLDSIFSILAPRSYPPVNKDYHEKFANIFCSLYSILWNGMAVWQWIWGCCFFFVHLHWLLEVFSIRSRAEALVILTGCDLGWESGKTRSEIAAWVSRFMAKIIRVWLNLQVAVTVLMNNYLSQMYSIYSICVLKTCINQMLIQNVTFNL